MLNCYKIRNRSDLSLDAMLNEAYKQGITDGRAEVAKEMIRTLEFSEHVKYPGNQVLPSVTVALLPRVQILVDEAPDTFLLRTSFRSLDKNNPRFESFIIYTDRRLKDDELVECIYAELKKSRG